MAENGSPPLKDPVSPEHKRFVLSQATVRLCVIALAVVALVVWLIVEV